MTKGAVMAEEYENRVIEDRPSFKTPLTACPKCGHEGNAATCANEPTAVPKAGDITICIRCGHAMAFTENLGRRELTEGEAQSVNTSPMVIAFRENLTRANKRHYS
jgi:Zn ribbon nucleic-acid-binding protein